MNKITIHDVAERCGVSISTVHQALYGKRGVSEETRERVKQIAEEMGYSPNPMASSLKRKTKHIALLLPDSAYHSTMSNGAREYLGSVPNLNLEWTEMPFNEGGGESGADFVERIKENAIDGVLVTGHSGLFSADDWLELKRSGIAVSLIGADIPNSFRISCTRPDYEIIGRTMAELVLSHIPFYGSIMLCAGNPKWEPHARVVLGFESYLYEHGAPNHLYLEHSWNREEASYRSILQCLSKPDVAACCSVLSQSSQLLGRALKESGKAGRIFAVGSDLSQENISYLKEGVFNNLIQKNPFAQGYLGARNLVEYLTLGKQPAAERTLVGSEVVFRSNVSVYEDRSYLNLLR